MHGSVQSATKIAGMYAFYQPNDPMTAGKYSWRQSAKVVDVDHELHNSHRDGPA